MNYSFAHPKPKIIAFCLIALCFCFCMPQTKATALDTNKIVYAYLPADTVLYQATQSSYTQIVALPKSYFVAILDDSNTDYFSVSYLDITGFALKSAVEVCDYQPVTKYATLKAIPNNDGLSINLRDTPDHLNGKVLQTIAPDTQLVLYGSIYGSALIAAVGDVWHYVKYTSGATSTFGYVYSGHVTADTPSPNIIQKVPQEPNGQDPNLIPAPPTFTTPMQIAFIIALSAPAVLIMLLIFKPKKSKKSPPTPRHSSF